MDALNVLITGAGAPGIKGTIYSLKHNYDNRPITTIGTDAKEEVIGKYICDIFHKIPNALDPAYIPELYSICQKEFVDVILPQNTAELLLLSENKRKFELIGTKIALSSKKAIEIANDKYRLMCLANNVGVPTPEYYLVDSLLDLLKYSEKLGWPEKPIVIKPPVSNGMRGVRIVDEHRNLKDMLYSEKPMNLYTHMDYLKMVLGNSFPPLLVMEYLPYEEWTVDVFSGNDITAVTRKRDNIRSGITFEGTCIKNEYMIDYSILLSKAIGLEYAFGFQFKLDSNHVPKLLESNPRIQGTMVLSTFADVNIIYAAVKYALGEEVAKLNPSWGTKIMRYWGGIGINDHTVLGKL